MPKNKTMSTSDFYCTECGNKGIPIAGKRFELYEDDIWDFLEKVGSGEINLDEVLEKERA